MASMTPGGDPQFGDLFTTAPRWLEFLPARSLGICCYVCASLREVKQLTRRQHRPCQLKHNDQIARHACNIPLLNFTRHHRHTHTIKYDEVCIFDDIQVECSLCSLFHLRSSAATILRWMMSYDHMGLHLMHDLRGAGDAS